MVSNVSRGTYQMASYLYTRFTRPQKENPRLDPLSTLVKLAILSKKPEGTKLSLEANYISFSEPYHWTIQAVLRRYQGDSYNDLRDLTKTLHKAVDWYSTDSDVQKIIQLSIQGLDNLKKTYGNTGKADAVQSYIDILKEIKKPEPQPADENGEQSQEGTLDDIKLHQILKEVWDQNTIKIILGFFDQIEKAESLQHTGEVEDLITGIEVLLKINHNKIEEQVRILSSIQ